MTISGKPSALSLGSDRGFSLIELMVAIAVGSLILAGVTNIIISNKQSYRSAEGLSQIQESHRTAMTMLERSIRGAGGTLCGNGDRVANVLNNATANWSWQSDSLRGYDGNQALPEVAIGGAISERVAGTDAIRVQSMGGSGIVVTGHNPSSAVIDINDTGNINDNDIVMVCDADHASIFQVTQVITGAQKKIQHHSGGGNQTPGNCTKGLGLPVVCSANGTPYTFPNNSTVARLSSEAWYIGNNGRLNEGGRSLYRFTPGEGAVEVVAGVSGLQLTYGVGQADKTATAITDWRNVDTVQVNLSLSSADTNIAVGGSQAERRLTREYSQLVSLRNRTL